LKILGLSCWKSHLFADFRGAAPVRLAGSPLSCELSQQILGPLAEEWFLTAGWKQPSRNKASRFKWQMTEAKTRREFAYLCLTEDLRGGAMLKKRRTSSTVSNNALFLLSRRLDQSNVEEKTRPQRSSFCISREMHQRGERQARL
jgi:hypothetical protein